VQTGVSLVLTRVFDSPASLFHTVFNRNVENCHAAFTIPTVLARALVPELLPNRKREVEPLRSFLCVIGFFLCF
jgi:hypothetical protein